jgi:hypothetical protein
MAPSLRIPTRPDFNDLEWFEVTSGDFQPFFFKKKNTNSNRGAMLKKTQIQTGVLC